MATTPIFGDKSHEIREQLRHLVAEVTKRFNLFLAPGVDTTARQGLSIFVVALSQSQALTEVAKRLAIEDDPQPTQFSESRARPRKSAARLAAEAIYQEGQRGRWRSRPLGVVTP